MKFRIKSGNVCEEVEADSAAQAALHVFATAPTHAQLGSIFSVKPESKAVFYQGTERFLTFGRAPACGGWAARISAHRKENFMSKASAEVSATRHTKGPWTLKMDRWAFMIPEINLRWHRSHSTDNEDDARIKASEQGQLESAIARLIASAPELLEALNQAIAYMANPKGWDAEGLDADWRLLKAKAEGRSQ